MVFFVDEGLFDLVVGEEGSLDSVGEGDLLFVRF